MSYDTIKNGIAARLNGLGYTESSQITDFKNASVNEYGNRYILKCLSGEQTEDNIIDRLTDIQDWQILVAFARSEQNDVVNFDMALRAKDAIIKDIDKPANWSGICLILKYQKWSLIETPNYFIVDIRLSIKDRLTY